MSQSTLLSGSLRSTTGCFIRQASCPGSGRGVPCRLRVKEVHRDALQVAAYMRLGQLQRAFQVAAASGSRAEVRAVAAEAGRRSNADVAARCMAFLTSSG